jgi:hypothetical protein
MRGKLPMVDTVSGRTVEAVDEFLLAPSMPWALLRDGRAQLIDLRGRDEFDVPRIPGARAVALDELPHELTNAGSRAACRARVRQRSQSGRSNAAVPGSRDDGVRYRRRHAGRLNAGLPIDSGAAEASASSRSPSR